MIILGDTVIPFSKDPAINAHIKRINDTLKQAGAIFHPTVKGRPRRILPTASFTHFTDIVDFYVENWKLDVDRPTKAFSAAYKGIAPGRTPRTDLAIYGPSCDKSWIYDYYNEEVGRLLAEHRDMTPDLRGFRYFVYAYAFILILNGFFGYHKHIAEFVFSLPPSLLLLLIVSLGVIAYGWRERFRLTYGVTEASVGAIASYYGFEASSFHYDAMTTAQWLQALGGIYIIVRGLDNMGKGFERTTMEPVWKRIFQPEGK